MAEQEKAQTMKGCLITIVGIIVGIGIIFLGSTSVGFLFMGVVVIVGIAIQVSEDKSYQAVQEEKRIQDEIFRENLRRQEEELYLLQKNRLISKYGEITKLIPIEEMDINKAIIVFENVNRIIINGLDMPMGNIISCTYADNPRIEKGAVSYETKTKNGNMIKRAVVGDVLLGSAGAVIGGATAKKTTVVHQENDRTYHDYTVIINVNSLSDPIIKIKLGQDGSKVNEIVGLMNVIISRKK